MKPRQSSPSGRVLAALLAVGLTAAACGGIDGLGTTTTVTSLPPSTTTTVAPATTSTSATSTTTTVPGDHP
jgi:hypothetical protein